MPRRKEGGGGGRTVSEILNSNSLQVKLKSILHNFGIFFVFLDFVQSTLVFLFSVLQLSYQN